MKISMIFGMFNNRWGWRVEWVEEGTEKFKDFPQSEVGSDDAGVLAGEFKQSLLDAEKAKAA